MTVSGIVNLVAQVADDGYISAILRGDPTISQGTAGFAVTTTFTDPFEFFGSVV